MIPKNNLDDRTFDDIVEEAIRLIPRYCPEWTNHNPADPGITLIELFAWMTEMTLYRLNQVPEKTYLSLLELMGLSLIPPQAARAVVRFFTVEGTRKSVPVKAGAQIAAVAGSEDTFMFETEQDITVSPAELVSCINRSGEKWKDYCEGSSLRPFTLFESDNSIEHVLYLASPVFSYLKNEHSIQISFVSPEEIVSVHDELINFLYWEYWDGRAWVHVEPRQAIAKKRRKDNVVYLTGPLHIEPCEVNGYQGFFIRAVLADVPDKQKVLSVTTIELQTYFGGLGFLPDVCLSNSGSQYTPLDLNGSFRIFSENPSYNEICYIAADDIFSVHGNKITLSFVFSEIYTPGNENDNALFFYEYWNGSNWEKIGASPRSESPGGPFSFKDSTYGFKQSGEVVFTVPQNSMPAVVNGEEHHWIRIRLVTKDFSIGGEYYKDEKDNWIWRFSSKVHSPEFSKIRISYDTGIQKPETCFSSSNFNWKVFELPQPGETEEGRGFTLFDITSDTTPKLYLGFSAAFPKGSGSFYVKINETLSAKPKKELFSFFNEGLFENEKERRLINFVWEYWNGTTWVSLTVNDYTDFFHESGFIEFATPEDMSAKNEFAKKLYWIRLNFVSGSFETMPQVLSIFTNAVYVQNKTQHINEIAGSGTGAPAQTITPAHSPLLPGIVLYVDEGSVPPSNELEKMKAEGIKEPYIIENEAVWIRYREVETFYTSTPISRHFVVDYREQKIYFGDGQRGINPPRRKFNIRLASYYSGGGAAGNVAAGALSTLSQSIPFIAGCVNPFPAEGGADMETVENLKARAAGVFKSLQRAVTAEDFQWLSREASASVGRAWCLKDKNPQGEICIIIIPARPAAAELSFKLIPSRELIRRVTSYLNDRKLVGTKIRVQGPLYRTFDIQLTLVFRSDVLDVERLTKEIERSLRTYFHPLEGSGGDGWEFGRVVTIGAVLKQLERIEGIISVDDVRLFDRDAGVLVEKLLLRVDEIPYLADVNVENRRETE